MKTPPPGTYILSDGTRFTMFEPISASNPPEGWENWPVVDLVEASRVDMHPPATSGAIPELLTQIKKVTDQLIPLLAALPSEKRAEILTGLVSRATSASTTTEIPQAP